MVHSNNSIYGVLVR